MTTDLSLTVLVDEPKSTDNLFVGEFGLSFFVESGKKKILFDTGSSCAFLANAGMMGIKIRDLDYVVLSHGHDDHTGGLVSLVRFLTERKSTTHSHKVPELIAHPCCFHPKPKGLLPNTGSPLSEAEVQRQFSVNLSDRPVWISDDLVFLGEVPRRFPFETTDPGERRIILPDGRAEPDLLLDDSALAFCSGAGLVIITGCSHSGICNITEYAREVCGERRVAGIVGGLHLLSPEPKRLVKTGKYLNRLHLKAIHTCHCTSPEARVALADYCPLRETGIGMTISW
jgi:7,8-dihydropterin-6-yl-methyl-4-(beta-D-ribofuranosyl)aminobenzene 5'-phosphate synthase